MSQRPREAPAERSEGGDEWIRHEGANVMTRPERPSAHARRRISPRQIVALVVIALTLIFIVQNRDTVQVHFFGLTVTAALWLLLIIMVALGVIIGMLAGRRK
jgi:uncharacterized integral membrane protein